MGISHIFEPKNYEFTNITDNDLYVSDCSQATYFAINEKQTQAASVSDFEFTYSSTGDETAKAAVPGTIVVNRPFIYAVYDSGNTNSIVLMGRVEKIEK
jgi:serine protease inhibitor